MIKLGVIGTGSMGSMLINKFTETNAISPGEILACNRTKEKVRNLSRQAGIAVAESAREVAQKANTIILCVKPLEVKSVLENLQDILTPGKLLISIAAGVTLDNLQAWSQARIIKVIPSLTSECLKGVALVSFSNRAREEDKKLVFSLFRAISNPVEIDENKFEILADLTSCAPALIVSVMKEFMLAAVRKDNLSELFAEKLLRETLVGTAGLLTNKEMSFDGLITRVATKGGITEEGVHVIRKYAPLMFDEVLKVTLDKHEHLKQLIRNQNDEASAKNEARSATPAAR